MKIIQNLASSEICVTAFMQKFLFIGMIFFLSLFTNEICIETKVCNITILLLIILTPSTFATSTER